jgi:hypothetical protein
MPYKLLTPKELLAQTLASAQKLKTAPAATTTSAVKATTTDLTNPTAAQQTIINQQAGAAQKAGVVTSAPAVDLPGSGGAYDKAMLASIFGTSGTTTPAATTPVNSTFAQYQQSATNAASNALDAQAAQANSIINSGGIWAALQPTAEKQMNDSIAALTQISVIAKANVESSRVALNAQDAADYAKVIDTLDKAVVASRQQTTEQMNQRGMFFSTVLDSVMGQVNAAYTTQTGQAAQQDKAALAKIASDMAVLSGNIDIETIKGNASAVAQYTASMLSVVAQDAQTKQTAQALLASLNVQKAGVIDTIAAQTFATGQQMKATAFNQQEQLNADAANAANTAFSQQAQLRGEATDAANTAFTQNLQTNAATSAATTDAQNQFIATMGQYANDYQAAANALDPNDPLYAFKEGMLESAHNQKATAITAAQQAAVLQAAKDKATAAQQTFDNILATAKVNISAATQQATAAYQSGQLSISQYNAATSRMNADTSRYNATKPAAGTTGGLTYSQANGVIDDYTKLTTTLGNLHQGTDGKWYKSVVNTLQTVDPVTKKVLPYTDMEVDVTTLKQQIADLAPTYKAAVAVRDKTSGTTTLSSLDATETGNVTGFIDRVAASTRGVGVVAYAQEYLKAVQASGTPLNQRELDAITAFYNNGDRSVYGGN